MPGGDHGDREGRRAPGGGGWTEHKQPPNFSPLVSQLLTLARPVWGGKREARPQTAEHVKLKKGEFPLLELYFCLWRVGRCCHCWVFSSWTPRAVGGKHGQEAMPSVVTLMWIPDSVPEVLIYCRQQSCSPLRVTAPPKPGVGTNAKIKMGTCSGTRYHPWIWLTVMHCAQQFKHWKVSQTEMFLRLRVVNVHLPPIPSNYVHLLNISTRWLLTAHEEKLTQAFGQ